ncbi:MAG: hypothetical protein KJ550_09615 [Proteobacteria bacterium]|nr:hypothetical protein [Desulfobacteraceae bacterium]MBU4013712.1 hypothetical protein [Pseudomonadota bacterium]MBU4067123.1 hypothetical protein [Pseudomonadota bacterium]MBU4101801.1 hypothetical protein [Pseudomonadota bacterium]MBU4127076.1 hypothetical protein [Pseudomonadota bacterium]
MSAESVATEQTINFISLFIHGLGQFTGVFLGVLAGTAVTLLVQFLIRKKDEKNQIENLRFELEINLKKIHEWRDELTKYRNTVNGDSLITYFGYFKLSSFIGVTVFQLHNSGTLYKYLTHELIGQLQEVFNDFSLNGENFLNNQIRQRKDTLVNLNESGNEELWQKQLKPEVVRDIDFWEQKFKTHENTIKNTIQALNK